MTLKEKKEYELALRIGRARHEATCKHSVTINGKCLWCKRRVK